MKCFKLRAESKVLKEDKYRFSVECKWIRVKERQYL